MKDVRGQIKQPSMFMTEGIVEEVGSGRAFDILLGLVWWDKAKPIWSTIYGGYGYATGMAGRVKAPLATGLCSELTAQFMVGGTMGWFTYQNYKQTFFDPANAAYVKYIQDLSAARIAGKAWMAFGRTTRSLELNEKTGTLFGQCFMRDLNPAEVTSIVCALAMPTNATQTTTFALAMDPAKYGLVVPAGGKVIVTDLMSGAAVGTYETRVTWSGVIDAFGVRVVKMVVG